MEPIRVGTTDIYTGDCLEILKQLPDGSVNCCVTSPPYYALRDYGTGEWVGGDPNCNHKAAVIEGSRFGRAMDNSSKQQTSAGTDVTKYAKVCPICGAVREDKQIGLEETPEQYIDKLVDVFREVRRVLRLDGTLWLNIGDSYWGSGSRGFDFTGKFTEASEIQNGSKGTINLSNVPKLTGKQGDYKNKDLIGIPWMLAFALRADGWYLRQDIIWAKPNPMPESVTDRCTRSHEYVFLMSKSPRYYYDYQSLKEQAVTEPQARDKNAEGYQADYAGGERFSEGMRVYGADGMRNKRDVWNIPVKPCKEAHFATFPEKLVEPCIMAGCPVGGTVLDPFGGSGTTALVADRLGRKAILTELNPEYVEIARRRLSNLTVQIGIDALLGGEP